MKPEDICRQFAEAFNAGDLEAVLALYEPEATLNPLPKPAPVSGHKAIRPVLAKFLALKGKFSTEIEFCLRSGDVALLRAHWQLTEGINSYGAPVNMAGHSAEVVRRQPDGRWLYLIDHPFGAD